MSILVAIILGIVEGLTEFLPVSSTGHLTIAEKLFGYSISGTGITAFTAVIQVGSVLATIVYFRRDIWQILTGWIAGLLDAKKRNHLDYRMGWAIIIGSIPIAIVGLVFKHQIETTLRSLWIVGFGLLLWSGVMWYADHYGKQNRREEKATWRDTLMIGTVQCVALIPGVSRSGATISAGLLRGLDRVSATRLSFFLAIPALLAAGALETVSQASNIGSGVGWTPTIVATITTFIVAYFSISWLLKFISHHDYTVFIIYRVILALVIIGLLATGVMSAN